MKKVEKGCFGYIRSQKIRRTAVTAALFAGLFALFFFGYARTGTRGNLFTVVAILGCLPASKMAVGMIVMLLQKPMDQALYEECRAHVKDMAVIYEACVSSYEKNVPLPCIVISGPCVVAYSEDKKLDTSFVEAHIQKILQGNGYKQSVKVFTDKQRFFRRVDELHALRKAQKDGAGATAPDGNVAENDRDARVRQVILCICT